MDQIPCPGCRTPLDAEVTCCPICLRPRTKYEITRAYSHLREDASRRRKKPFIVGGWMIVAAAAAYGAWQFRAPILGAAAVARAKISGFADYSMDPRNLVPKSAEAPATPAAPVESSVSAPAPAAAFAPAAPPAPAPAPSGPGTGPQRTPIDPTAKPPLPAQPPELRMPVINPAIQWTMYGHAYDVVTLRPAANVQLLFQVTDTGSSVGSSMTDDYGRYVVVLPRIGQGGMSALASDNKYAPLVLCESDIPYRTLGVEERRTLARSAQDGDMRPASLSDTPGEATQKRDLFLAPTR